MPKKKMLKTELVLTLLTDFTRGSGNPMEWGWEALLDLHPDEKVKAQKIDEVPISPIVKAVDTLASAIHAERQATDDAKFADANDEEGSQLLQAETAFLEATEAALAAVKACLEPSDEPIQLYFVGCQMTDDQGNDCDFDMHVEARSQGEAEALWYDHWHKADSPIFAAAYAEARDSDDYPTPDCVIMIQPKGVVGVHLWGSSHGG